MIFENINLQDERLKKEQNTLRFKKVMNRWKDLSSVCDAELKDMLKKIYKDDEKYFAPPPGNMLREKKLSGFAFFREEARIVQVFTLEAEIMMRDPLCGVSIDDIIELYMNEVRTLKHEHLEYQNQTGKTDEYGSNDQQDDYVASTMEENNPADWFDLPSSPSQISISDHIVEQKLHNEWLRSNFPSERLVGVMDDPFIREVYRWMTSMSQDFVTRLFELDDKSIVVFSSIVLRGMKQKEVAQIFGETPGAICKRFDKIVFHLYGKSKRQIKEERRQQVRHRREYNKQISRIKKEYAAEQKAKMEVLTNPEVRIYKYE